MEKKIVIPGTELSVYPIGLGTVGAGLKWDGADADKIFDTYLDNGGNLIDSAHVYSDWVKPEIARSERVIGDWFSRSGKREQVVLVTKGGHPDMTPEVPDLHKSRMTKADMVHDLDGSLKQLRTDYIDIYFYHRDDENQSVEEEVEVMEEFVRQGKIRYYACSNWSTARMQAAMDYAKEKGYRGFVANQALLNLASDHITELDDDTLARVDEEMKAFHRERPEVLCMPYMGVASGFFHRYAAKGEDAVKGIKQYYTPENVALAERVLKLMKEYGISISQAVLGYFFTQDFACAPLYGPKNAEQMLDAMGTLEIAFKKEDYLL